MIKSKSLLWIAVFAAIIVLSFTAYRMQSGDPVPEFSLTSIDGETVSSKSLLGTPYVIPVFATWCPPCKTELAVMEAEIWQPLKDQGAKVIAINYGNESAELIRGFAQENGLTFPMLVDMDGDFSSAVGVSGIPHSIVVGADGNIIDMHVGYTYEGVQAIKQALEAEL